MSKQGIKGGKGLGKVRQCDCLEGGTTKPAIQKLARCGGLKRLSGLSYDQPCDFVKNCVQDALTQLEAETFIANYMEYGFFSLSTQGRIRRSSELSSASSGSSGNYEKSN